MNSSNKNNTVPQASGLNALKPTGSAAPCSSPTLDDIIAFLKRSIVEAQFSALAFDQIDENAPLVEEGLGLDSVMLIELIVTIETQLQFGFLESDLRMRSFASLRTLAQVVLSRLSGGGDPS